MNCSMPEFPDLHYLPEFAQTHVHWVSDAMQPSHPLSSPSLALNLSQHQGLFLMYQLLAPGSPRIGASASATVLPINIQGWFPLGLIGLISFCPRRLSRVFSNTTAGKHQFFSTQAFFMVQPSHPYLTARKTIALTIWTFVSKVMSLLFNTLSRFVIAILPRSKRILILWLQTLSPLILEPKRIWHCFYFLLINLPWNDRTRCHDLSFLNVEF